MEIYDEFLNAVKAFDEKRYSDAIYHLRRVKRREPAKLSVRELLGRAYFKNGQYKKALYEFEFIIENRPDSDYAYFCAGLCQLKLGNKAKGVENLRIALALNPLNKEYQRFYRFYSSID